MKIKLNKIISDKFQVREQLDNEHLDSIMESLKKDGQWHPIIVRPTEDGSYDLIAGHYRYTAAKNLGWQEIEATVKDTDDASSRILALKTNLLSKTMTEIEEGKILKFILERDQLTQTELGKRIGKSPPWISKRLSLVLDIHDNVKKALTNGKISMMLIPVIATVEKNRQTVFMNTLIERNIKSESEARKLRDRLENDTIYTIGFMGKRIIEFINILNENEIKTVIDIRYNTMSQFKPDFSQDILKRELKRDKKDYIHLKVFGVPPMMRDAVIAGYDSDCFRKWYRLNVKTINKDEFKQFLSDLKKHEQSVLLCSEEHPKPKASQKHFCHRDFLADLIIESSKKFKDETLHFSKRVDL